MTTTPAYMPILGTPFAIRMSMLTEEWAQRLHGQSLAKLADRGGLSMREAAAVAGQRSYRDVRTKQAAAQLMAAAPTMPRALTASLMQHEDPDAYCVMAAFLKEADARAVLAQVSGGCSRTIAPQIADTRQTNA